MDAHTLLESLAIVTTMLLVMVGGHAAAALRVDEVEAEEPAIAGS